MKDFDLKKYLAEGKLATNEVYSEKQRKWACAQDGPKFDEMCKDTAISKKKKIKEFVGKELEDRNEEFYHLVPGQGKADTMEGEMLRAINKIVYRWYNDGDEYHIGYGTETAGPAHSFLVNANHPLKAKLYAMFTRGTDYETTIKAVLEEILDYIEGMAGNYTDNTLGDMLDYEAEFEDETEDEYDDYDDYDDYEDEDEY